MSMPGTQDDPIFEQLKKWRDRAVRESRMPLGAFKDSYLRSIARTGRRTAQEIERMLPTSLRPFAAELAEQMDRLIAEQQPPGAPTGPTGSTGPVAAGGQTAPVDPIDPIDPIVSSAPRQPAQPDPAPPGRADAVPTDTGPMAQPATYPTQTTVGTSGQQHHASGASERAGGQSGERTGDLVHLDALRFAPYDYSTSPGEVARLAISADERGLAVRWPAADGAGRLTAYRLVGADDAYPPYAPDQADLIALTSETGATDTRPFTSAVRHLQVWRNSGETVDELYLRQPILHAEGAAVAPVQQVDISEDQGQVIARWNTLPGVERVHVYRIPAERAARGVDPQYRILPGESNLGGFVDRQAERGRRYVYLFQSEATVGDSAQLSAPIRRELTVSAVLIGVDDLTAEQHGDDDQPVFALTWRRPPAGRVVIFRTPNGPTAGAEGQVVEISALPGMGLTDEALLTHPVVQVDRGDGVVRDAMTDVPWPPDWDRAYLTPVTVLDGRARVGRSVPAVRVHRVTDPVLVERCDEQIVKFGWPSDAASVVLQVTRPGQPPDPDNWPLEIARQRYELLGGFPFPRPLPAAGCTVHLAGRSYTAGRDEHGRPVGVPVIGTPVSVDYPGLLRLRYLARSKRGLLRKEIGIQVTAEQELLDRRVPPLVLVYRPDRLPLHPEDGTPLEVSQDIDEVTPPTRRFQPRRVTPQPADCAWKASVKGLSGGFVRLFVDLPPEVVSRVALLDPPVDDLRVR